MKLKLTTLLPTLIKRIKLPDTPIGKAVTRIGTLVGVGGAAAATYGMFELTGDRITDLAIIVCTTLIIVLGGKAQVPDEHKNEL